MKELIEETSAGLIEVLAQTDRGAIKVGTGFAVTSEGLIATCLHVIADAPAIVVQLPGETRGIPANVVAQNTDRDIVVLSVEHRTNPARLGDFEQVAVGEDVIWGGYPLENRVPSFHRGMISFKGALRLPGTKGDTDCLQLDGTSNKGNSGGPIIDPRDRRVVAIVSSGLGTLDEELEALLRERPEGSLQISLGGIDPLATLRRMIASMERHLQLGVAYGISVRYLTPLLSGV